MDNEDVTKRVREEPEEIENSKKAKQSPVEDALDDEAEKKGEDVLCIVCMEGNSDENPLLEAHQCDQCKKDAWRICVCCNESILSRACPVCRGNYAPINLHVIPGLPISQLADKTLSPDAKALLLYKFGIIRRLIEKTNVAVWNPDKAVLHLSLPQEPAEGSTAASYLTVTIPIQPERITDGMFPINNSVWDEIENEVENGAEQTGVIMRTAEAAQWLLSFTRHWENTLDPNTCQETAEAVQSIMAGIAPAPAQAAAPAEGGSA
jgi:hypothetical protein